MAPSLPAVRRRLSGLRRQASLGLAIAEAAAHRPSAPLKLNLCLTYWCQYRCKTCNIWQRKPTDELTTAELIALVRENPDVTWADLTGGEIFLRPDLDEIFDAMLAGWRRLALLHFPTNGFLTDRIVRTAARIAGRGPAHTIITVSVDGDEALNDEIRGIRGGFRRQMETFSALRRIPHIRAALGLTLSSYNAAQIDRTFDACAHACPGLLTTDVHLNVAQQSGHYYGNEDTAGIAPDASAARAALRRHRQRRHVRGPAQLLENAYLRHLDEFLETGRTPMPCHALRASCFIDPWGVVFPCITFSRPLGHLRDTGMRLAPIWNGGDATAACSGRSGRAVPAVLDGVRGVPEHSRQCPGVFRRTTRPGPAGGRAEAGRHRGGVMHAVCFEDQVTRSRLDRAAVHPLADGVTVVIAAKDEAPSIEDVVAGASLRLGHPRRGWALGGRDRRPGGQGGARSFHSTRPPGRAPPCGRRFRSWRRRLRCSWMATVARAGGHPAAGRAHPGRRGRSRLGLPPAWRVSELHGGFDELLRLAGSAVRHGLHQLAVRRRLSDSQNGFRAIRTALLRSSACAPTRPRSSRR